MEGAGGHHPPSRDRGRRPRRAGLPRVLVRGRRVRPCAWRARCRPRRNGSGRRPGAEARICRGSRDERSRHPRASARCGSGRYAFRRLPGLSSPIRTASTRRSSSASATACCGADPGRPPARRKRDLPQLGPTLRRQSSSGVRTDKGGLMERPHHRSSSRRGRSGSTPSRRRRGALARRRRARRPDATVQGAAAKALLRRMRRRALRPDLRAARVLPDAHRARDPRERAGEIAALTGAVELVELGSGTAAKTRVLLDALEQAGTLSATSRSTSPRAWSATAPRN